MERVLIRGGKPLRGKVRVSGAKNAALPVLAATLMSREKCRVENVPSLRDVDTICRLLRCFRLGIESQEPGVIALDPSGAQNATAPYELVRTMRASVLVMGPLLARFGTARVSLPGGCAIGPRPINLHLKGFEAMGARVSLGDGYINLEAGELRGARIYLDIPSVTGTENLMMAASLARGETLIENAAREPEVVNLAQALNAMGAEVEGAGTDAVLVRGVRELGGLDRRIIPDRIEAGTYMVAGAITGGDVKVSGCVPEHFLSLTLKLRELGEEVEEGEDFVRVLGHFPKRAADVTTSPFPGFPTDMQAQFMALLCLAEGASVVTETVFESRFMHVGELNRMGADITPEGPSALVRGVGRLTAAEVMATDLRASACLILAGLAAEGETAVSRVYHIDRGYERIEEKLQGLGADIRRVP